LIEITRDQFQILGKLLRIKRLCQPPQPDQAFTDGGKSTQANGKLGDR
jgi:hypothetical protein